MIGSYKATEFFIALGADVNAKDKYGWTPLFSAASNGHLEICKLLVSHGAEWNKAVPEYGFPASQAAAEDLLEVVKYFIEELGFDANAKDKDGLSPLFYAAWKGSLEVCKLLVSHGAEWNRAVPKYGFPASQAAAEDHLEVVKYFVEELGFDINAKDKDGWTLLHWAAYFGSKKVAKYLIKKGADVNAKDKYGWTPLHKAAVWGKIEVAKLLLSHGADVNAKTTKKDECCDKTFPAGSTPLDVAILAGKTEIAKLLISHGGRCNATCSR